MNHPVFQNILSHSILGNNQIKFKIDPRTIYDFFSSGLTKEKHIPDYQRPYSWEEENVKRLIDDIIDLTIKQSVDKSWFLGPVFTTFIDGDNYSYLLDGQQRTTTIVLILKQFLLLQNSINEFEFGSESIHIKEKYDKNYSNCINCIFYQSGAGIETIRLKTEPTSQNFFSKFINFTPRNDKEIKDGFTKFESDAKELLTEEGATSALRIFKNSVYIRNRFLDFLKEDFPNNIHKINTFIETLLFNCWLIEIPIREDEYSINIFESINNRGRSLTLVDKIRFRTLVLIKNRQKREIALDLWKEIFKNLEKILEFKFIKSEEDFFKILINSFTGESYTKESEIIQYFEKEKLKDDDKIIIFLEDCIRVIEANILIREAFTIPDHKFINKFKKNEKKKIISLFFLAEKMLKTSDNSRFLFYRNILDNYPENNYPFILSLWNNIRLTMYWEIFVSETSNIVREEYLKIIKDNKLLEDFIKKDYVKLNQLSLEKDAAYQLNLLRSKNADKSQFIICFYSFLMNSESLLENFHPHFVKTVEVEHCLPKKWIKHWKPNGAEFKFENVSSYLQKYDFNNLNYLEHKKIIDLIQMRDKEIELPENQLPSENCIIEYIGNKWLFQSSDNKTATNKDWNYKAKTIFENSNIFKFPNNEDKLVGFKIYNKGIFSYEDILDRSFKIVNKIIESYHKNFLTDI